MPPYIFKSNPHKYSVKMKGRCIFSVFAFKLVNIWGGKVNGSAGSIFMST